MKLTKQFFMLSSAVACTVMLMGSAMTSNTAFAATNTFGNYALSYGSQGQDVHVLQLALEDFGTFPQSVTPTYYFGSATDKAVRNFQQDFGLSVDGVAGPATKQALMREGYQEYIVAPSDSLWSIAQNLGTTVNQLQVLNHLNTTSLQDGQALLVHAQAGNTTASNSIQNNTGTQANSNPTQSNSTQNSSVPVQVQQVVNLVNQERAQNGLAPLTLDPRLAQMAHDKAADMRDHNYFDHQSPTYGSPFDMMKEYGISYTYAGENIAAGQTSAQDVMNAWMNSSGHRANILNPNYTEIGVGYVTGGQYGTEWVQEFIHPQN